MKTRQKQHGVVLLSCLMILLMLLIILRFSLGSARIEEMKAGADYDEMQAKAAASIVLKSAENFIEQIDRDGNSLQASGKNIKNDEGAVLEAAVKYWQNANPSTVTGIYDGDAADSKDNYKKIKGTLACDADVICVRDSKNLLVGKYIIERFKSDGNVLKQKDKIDPKTNQPILDAKGNKVKTEGFTQDDKDTVLLRVTAIGFSKPMAENANRNSNISNSIVQAVYVLAPSK